MKKLLYILLLLPCFVSGQGVSGWFAKSFESSLPPAQTDSLFIEAEHMTYINGSFGTYATYYSNDTSANMNSSSRGVEYTLLFPSDSLSMTARIDRTDISVKIVVNGVDSVAVNNIPYLNAPDKIQDVGVSIDLDAGDVIQIIRTAQYLFLDYVIFYYQYE